MWRTTPIHRRELEGSWPDDAPPEIAASVDLAAVQRPQDGVGPFLRRRYRARLGDARASAMELMRDVQADPNRVTPSALAHFSKTLGDAGRLSVGDEFVVRMPGPWDGPVRVVDRTPGSFRFATLDGHIEAGQIEWRAREDGDV